MNRYSHIKKTLIAIYKIVYEDSNKAKKIKKRRDNDRAWRWTFWSNRQKQS